MIISDWVKIPKVWLNKKITNKINLLKTILKFNEKKISFLYFINKIPIGLESEAVQWVDPKIYYKIN